MLIFLFLNIYNFFLGCFFKFNYLKFFILFKKYLKIESMWDLQKVIQDLKMKSTTKGKNKRDLKKSSILRDAMRSTKK